MVEPLSFCFYLTLRKEYTILSYLSSQNVRALLLWPCWRSRKKCQYWRFKPLEKCQISGIISLENAQRQPPMLEPSQLKKQLLLRCAVGAVVFLCVNTASRRPGSYRPASAGSALPRRFPCARRRSASRRSRCPSWVWAGDS